MLLLCCVGLPLAAHELAEEGNLPAHHFEVLDVQLTKAELSITYVGFKDALTGQSILVDELFNWFADNNLLWASHFPESTTTSTSSAVANSLVAPPTAADPDALNIQSVNGVECYPVLDRLEICGAADTIPIMLYTKSEESLTEIRVNVQFSEGMEYAGFVIIPDEPESPIPAADVDLEIISDANPESLTFLISEINESIGNVIVYIGVRAECGADLTAPATATFNYDYTDPAVGACSGSFTPAPYSATTIEPIIEFVGNPAPITRALGSAGADACQTLTITQITPGAGASGFEFTATDYGFADGIMISRLDFDGATVDPADYMIAADGTLTFAASDITADNLLRFNENSTITVCYTYADCFPNVDYTPNYSIVTSCDGVVCSAHSLCFYGHWFVRLASARLNQCFSSSDLRKAFDLSCS